MCVAWFDNFFHHLHHWEAYRVTLEVLIKTEGKTAELQKQPVSRICQLIRTAEIFSKALTYHIIVVTRENTTCHNTTNESELVSKGNHLNSEDLIEYKFLICLKDILFKKSTFSPLLVAC